jgi:hypothetical protein
MNFPFFRFQYFKKPGVLLLGLLLLGLAACDFEDSEAPEIDESTIRFLQFNEARERFEGDVFANGLEVPRVVRFEALFRDNTNLAFYRMVLTTDAAQPTGFTNRTRFLLADSVPVSGNATVVARDFRFPSNVVPGSYTLAVTLFDLEGNQTQTTPRQFAVTNNNPVLELLAPLSDSVAIAQTGALLFTAQMQANRGLERFLVILADDESLDTLRIANLSGNSASQSFSVPLANFEPGDYQWTFIVVDQENAQGRLSGKLNVLP